MTENEAIVQLNFDMEMIRFNPETGETLTLEQIKAWNEANYKTYLADEVAITALLEIQQYRAIGMTPNQIYVHIGGYAAELSKYAEIGTIEECRTAVERMKPKIKPAIEYYDIHKDGWCVCPNCVKGIGWLSKKDQNSFCRHCGAEFDWSE